jgi:hypothetical protein
MPRLPSTDLLFQDFLTHAEGISPSVEPVRVLKARVFRIVNSHVLIRAAALGKRNSYFFGINYITIEEIANLDNPFVVFICGSVGKSIIMPAEILFEHLPDISHDRNGEYKINLDSNCNLILKGKQNRINCSEYLNAWNLIQNPPKAVSDANTAEQSLHSILQGRLIEVGNIRGFLTYCPNKSKSFNGKVLSEIASLKTCPDLQFSKYDVLRQIDVLWFKERGSNLIPECGFEIEISTGTWSGVGRLASLYDYSNTRLYVVSDDTKKYQQVMGSFAEYQPRYKHIRPDLIGELYSAEIGLRDLRQKIGLL